MATTQVDVITAVRKAIDDALTGGNTGKFFSDAQILELVLKNAQQESNFPFVRISDGYYVYQGDENTFFFNPSFTESSNCDYVFNASGSIIVTEGAYDPGDPDASPTPIPETPAGDETRTQINVVACRVNFYRIIAQCFLYFANSKAKIIAQSGDLGSISPATVRQECMAQAAEYEVRAWSSS